MEHVTKHVQQTNYSLNDHHHATVPIRKGIFDKMRSQPVNADKEGGTSEIDLLKLKVTQAYGSKSG